MTQLVPFLILVCPYIYPDTGSMHFQKHDTVIQIKSKKIFVLDSLIYRGKKHQAFWNARYLDGVYAPWLPETSIIKCKTK